MSGSTSRSRTRTFTRCDVLRHGNSGVAYGAGKIFCTRPIPRWRLDWPRRQGEWKRQERRYATAGTGNLRTLVVTTRFWSVISGGEFGVAVSRTAYDLIRQAGLAGVYLRRTADRVMVRPTRPDEPKLGKRRKDSSLTTGKAISGRSAVGGTWAGFL